MLLSAALLLGIAGCAALTPWTQDPSSPVGVAATGSPDDASLSASDWEARLRAKDAEVERLRATLERMRGAKTQGGDARAPGTRGSRSGAPPETWGRTVAALPDTAGEPPPAPAVDSAEVEHLRGELTQERQRREAAEYELSRLKREASAPAFGDRRVPESDFLAAKQDLVELRRMLNAERAQREAIARQLEDLRWAAPSRGDATRPEPALERQRAAISADLERSLEASERRAKDLEAEVAELRSAATNSAPADTAGLATENENLRKRLDAERKRNADLARKLAVARRITETIYETDEEPVERPEETEPQ